MNENHASHPVSVARALRRAAAVAAAVLVASTTVIIAMTAPADARDFDPLTVTQKRVFVEYDAIPSSLPLQRRPDPDMCRTADFCDTIPLRIPVPTDIGAGDDYMLRFRVDFDDLGQTNDIDVYMWDNKQLKQKYGKTEPGETNYDPLESDYTDLISETDPKGKGWIEYGEPDLVDYNLTILNYSGTNIGYSITAEIVTEAFTPPGEVLPPEPYFPPPPGPISAGGSTGFEVDLPSTTLPPLATGGSGFGLDEIAAIEDPDLQAIVEQNLLEQLEAPTDLLERPSTTKEKPDPPSGLTLFLWLAVTPAALAGSATFLLLRQRAAFSFG